MTKKQFKKKYLSNSFYWVTKENHIRLQEILQEFGIKCHTGEGFIKWHDTFYNLCTFEADHSHNFNYYQKVGFWSPDSRYGDPVSVDELFSQYDLLV